MEMVRSLARQFGIPFYNFKSGEGELRFLVVREGKLTGDFMLNLVHSTAGSPDAKSCLRELLNR